MAGQDPLVRVVFRVELGKIMFIPILEHNQLEDESILSITRLNRENQMVSCGRIRENDNQECFEKLFYRVWCVCQHSIVEFPEFWERVFLFLV